MAKKHIEPESCESCRFFQPNDHDEVGYCRRTPPVALSDGESNYQCVKVVTEAGEWCGCFERRLNS